MTWNLSVKKLFNTVWKFHILGRYIMVSASWWQPFCGWTIRLAVPITISPNAKSACTFNGRTSPSLLIGLKQQLEMHSSPPPLEASSPFPSKSIRALSFHLSFTGCGNAERISGVVHKQHKNSVHTWDFFNMPSLLFLHSALLTEGYHRLCPCGTKVIMKGFESQLLTDSCLWIMLMRLVWIN